jgi:hypothetical protein
MTVALAALLLTEFVSVGALDSGPLVVSIPSPPGLEVTYLYASVIAGARDTQAFRFNDGRIAVDAGSTSFYSFDYGHTWIEGPQAPATYNTKVAFDFGDGEIISFGRTTTKKNGLLYDAGQFRSVDGWRTSLSGIGSFDTPQAVASTSDTGQLKPNEGLMMHHGIVRLANGDLLATMYGNYGGDTALVEGVPASWNLRKFRTVVISSSDRGRFWSRPVTVAYDRMLDPSTGTVVPAVAREGFNEADMARTEAGELVVVMRTGGRTNVEPQPEPTPMYLSRSRDEGQSWSTPIAITDRGTNPSLITLGNGVMVLTYAGRGEWITFSADSGETWSGTFHLSDRDSYTSVVPLDRDSFIVFYFPSSGPGGIRAAAFRVQRRGTPPQVDFWATPAVLSGSDAVLSWDVSNARNCVLSGGAWGAGMAQEAAATVRSGTLTEETTFALRCESASDAGLVTQKRQTVRVATSELQAFPARVPSSTAQTARYR